LADEPVPPDTLLRLKELCEAIAVVPVARFGRWARAGWSVLAGRSLSEGLFSEAQLRATIRGWTAQTRFAAVIISASSLGTYLHRDGLEQVPAVVDLVDVDSQKWFDFAGASIWPRSGLYRLEAKRIRQLEAELPRRTRAVSVVSRVEADVYERFAGPGTATVATNGVDLDYFQPTGSAQEQSCAFVGAMDYLPNVDAVVWFAKEVWGPLRARFPDAEFRIVGRKPTALVQRLATLPGIVVTGSVPDVRPYVSNVGVVVAPLRLGRGVQNKVLEAHAMGKAVVASPQALAALATQSGQHVVMATSSAEWLAALSDLFKQPERCRELGLAGRAYVERHHHWEHCLEPLLEKIFSPVAGSM
jgi:sugar transferase (PEP-CTERM/EpsH1 system associated)